MNVMAFADLNIAGTFLDSEKALHHITHLIDGLNWPHSLRDKKYARTLEIYTFLYHLKTLIENGRIEFPLKIMPKQESPDFSITSGGVRIGIEHTMATEENYQRWLRETNGVNGVRSYYDSDDLSQIGTEEERKIARYIMQGIIRKNERLENIYRPINRDTAVFDLLFCADCDPILHTDTLGKTVLSFYKASKLYKKNKFRQISVFTPGVPLSGRNEKLILINEKTELELLPLQHSHSNP